MKRILSGISLAVLIFSCSGVANIKNTEWEGVGDYAGRMALSFKDSTCLLYDMRLGKPDTIHSRYELRGDTIVFTPVSESIAIGNHIIRGNDLFSEKYQVSVFKLKK